MAPKKKQSDSERLRKKREAEKKRLERIKQDPERLQQEKFKMHQKYLNKLQKGQRKLIADQTDREKRKTRKIGKEATDKSRKRKKDAEDEERILNENSPPPSEDGSPMRAEPPQPDGRRRSGRKKIKRNKTKIYRDMEKLTLKFNKSRQKAERYKKLYLRLLKSCKEQENIEATPRTKVKRLLKGQAVSEVVRKRLVFGELIEQQLSKSYRSTANIRDKHLIRNIFNPDKLHKYKVKKAVERLVGINKAKCNTDYKALHLNICN